MNIPQIRRLAESYGFYFEEQHDYSGRSDRYNENHRVLIDAVHPNYRIVVQNDMKTKWTLNQCIREKSDYGTTILLDPILKNVCLEEALQKANELKKERMQQSMHGFVDYTKMVETEALAYERGSMLREDSEVELDVTYDEETGKDWIMLYDYSEERGSAEFVKKICEAELVTEEQFDDIVKRNSWCFVKDGQFKDEPDYERD